LIVRGDLPAPDVTVIADTSRENSNTWAYLHDVVQPALKTVGVTVEVAPHSLATVDLWTGASKSTIAMPMFTNRNGSVGMLPKYCSQEWKTRVVHRWLRARGIRAGDMWIGFSVDEIQRCRTPQPPYPHRYPLIERRMSRADCVALVERMGWPTPPRSSCWMCPYKADHEWRGLSSGDFAKAVALEAEIQQQDPNVYLHRSCRPLAEALQGGGQTDAVDGADECSSGMCFT
jgi:hypothetical protein